MYKRSRSPIQLPRCEWFALRGLTLLLVALICSSRAETTTFSEGSHQKGVAATAGVAPVAARADLCADVVAGSVLEVRGGHDFSPPQDSAEEIVERYLAADRKAANKSRFHVQGWRWHTLSLVRDARRMEMLALHQLSAGAGGEDEIAGIEKAAKHVVDFNMAGLHRIEDELFFPWVRDKLCAGDDHEDLKEAFREIIDGIDEDRRHVSKLGQAMREQAKIASSTEVNADRRVEAISNVARMSAALNTRAQGVLDREERLLVPAVAKTVPEKEQKSFNNRVVRSLGILDSRVHLVGMHDAVWEGSDERERALFNEAIPVLPRMMIPRWRRLLYEPVAGVLDIMKKD